MCFHIEKGVNSKFKIAKKDITCYKMIFLNDRAYYQNFAYSPNTLYNFINIKKEFDIIEKGYHSYSTKYKAFCSGNKFYCKIVKFIIPKGTKYYYNSFYKEYVSTKIKSGNLKSLD